MFSSDKEMASVQAAALEVLQVFQKICKKHNLRYFAIGGTCIGAVRHQGFIPWDDDIDVGMPYEDYLEFMRVAEEEMPDNYSVITPSNCKHYLSIISKLQNKNTTFIETLSGEYEDRYSGIYIDIFPVFGLPRDMTDVMKIQLKKKKYHSLNLRMRFSLSDEEHLHGKLLWLAMVPLRMVLPFDYYIKKQIKLFSKYKFDDSDKVYFCWRSVEDPAKPRKVYNAIFNYDDFRELIEVPFEDGTISIPKGYDGYLTHDFGDYMTLPPVEKRVSGHPKALIDLNTPFSHYYGKDLTKVHIAESEK